MKRTSQALPLGARLHCVPRAGCDTGQERRDSRNALPDLRDVKPRGGRLAAMGWKEGNIPVAAGPMACPTADQQTSVELLCLY